MSTPASGYPNPLGFPPQERRVSGSDVAGITAAMNQAVAALRENERGAVTFKLEDRAFGAGVVLRGPFNTQALGSLTKPKGGAWSWSVAGRIAFLAGEAEAVILQVQPPTYEKQPGGAVRFDPKLADLFRIFRANGNGIVASAIKAVVANRGGEVLLRGGSMS